MPKSNKTDHKVRDSRYAGDSDGGRTDETVQVRKVRSRQEETPLSSPPP